MNVFDPTGQQPYIRLMSVRDSNQATTLSQQTVYSYSIFHWVERKASGEWHESDIIKIDTAQATFLPEKDNHIKFGGRRVDEKNRRRTNSSVNMNMNKSKGENTEKVGGGPKMR